jgi:very-short-patch-repair endonuclease
MREKTMNKVIRRKVLSSTASEKVDLFLNYLQQQFPQAEVVKELQFHPDRKWRFDYAFPSRKIAIEIDGAIWTLGRHNRPRGYLNDMEKLNTAASMGWLVLRFSTDERFYLSTRRLIEVTLVQRANNNQ